jgi:hypothetical protein
MKPRQFPILIFHCASEGQRMDGKELGMTLQEFTDQLKLGQVAEFNRIYTRQSIPADTLLQVKKKDCAE